MNKNNKERKPVPPPRVAGMNLLDLSGEFLRNNSPAHEGAEDPPESVKKRRNLKLAKKIRLQINDIRDLSDLLRIDYEKGGPAGKIPGRESS